MTYISEEIKYFVLGECQNSIISSHVVNVLGNIWVRCISYMDLLLYTYHLHANVVLTAGLVGNVAFTRWLFTLCFAAGLMLKVCTEVLQ